MLADITLRPETTQDAPFLEDLYASSRAREMALLDTWTTDQKSVFLKSQFLAQHRHYRQHYPDARYDIILRGGTPIGRLYVADMSNELRLMDITLLESVRNAGLGTLLVNKLLNEAEQERKIVSLHVEDENPARRLYDRLGFVEVGEVTFYKRMHWVPRGLETLNEKLAAEVQARSPA